MHFIGDGVGFRRSILVIVFLIRVLITFVITFMITVQCFLQLFELGRLDKRFGNGFDRLGALLGVGLRFFVLGLRQLLGKRGYFLLGHVRDMRVRYVRGTRFGIKPVEVARDFGFGVRRCGSILRRAGRWFGAQSGNGSFVFLWNCVWRGREKRSRQSRGQFFIRESPWRGPRGRSFGAERRLFGSRRRRSRRSTIFEF